MTESIKREIAEDIETSEMFIKDLERLWKSYAKKALIAKQERELKQSKKGFLDCETEQELIDLYGYGEFDEETYHRGLEYFKSFDGPPELSVIEKYRVKLKELINREKGTIKELHEEINPTEKVQEENTFDRYNRLQREERNKALQLSELLGG